MTVLICGGMALTIAIGTRQNMGLYLYPMTTDLGMSRQTFSFAIAIQNLFYGLAQTLFPALAARSDRRTQEWVREFTQLGEKLGLTLEIHGTEKFRPEPAVA